jgi:hypothetical protein
MDWKLRVEVSPIRHIEDGVWHDWAVQEKPMS